MGQRGGFSNSWCRGDPWRFFFMALMQDSRFRANPWRFFLVLPGGVFRWSRREEGEIYYSGRTPGHFFDLSDHYFVVVAGVSCEAINLGKAGSVSGAGLE